MASTKTRTKRGPRKSDDGAHKARERVLGAFSERAKRSGIRSVVMGELASELRISPSTLYSHFRSKEELVTSMVQLWSAELGTEEAVIRDASKTPLTRFLLWADAWSRRLVEYSPSFWSDLKHHYPAAWDDLQKDLARRKALGAALLRPLVREELNPEIALTVLDLIFTHVSDAKLWDRLGVSRQQGVQAALTIWAKGALRNGGDAQGHDHGQKRARSRA